MGEAEAQTVAGTVRDAESLRPLPTALVALLDASGARVAAAVSDHDGRFALEAPEAGTFQLRTRLLGFDDSTSEPFDLAADVRLQRDILVSVRVVRLAGIEVSTSKSCRSLSAAGPALATVWGEARTALETVAWTAQTGGLVYHVAEFRRTLDESTLAVQEADEELRRGTYAGSPYVSVPADTLLANGYVRRGADGSRAWDYWAPDADVLLSDAFLDTHCFGIHPESDEERIGLLFEPVAERDVPEIEGALWLDRRSSELQSLEFRYVGLPSDHPESPHLGGEVEFENLATGEWIVRGWRIRMPNVELRLRAAGIRRVIDSYVEQGARVLRVGTLDGMTLADAVGATITGTVLADGTGRPLPGAELEIASTEHRTVSEPDGSYRLGGLPTGTFEVRVSHPWLDVLGMGLVRRTVALEEGRTARLPVDVDIASGLRRYCPSVPDARVVHGVVRDPSVDQPIGRVTVRVGEAEAGATDVSDGMGRWAVCLPARPRSVPIVLLSPAGEERARIVAALNDDPVVEVQLEAEASAFVDRPDTPAPESSDADEEVLRGVLQEYGSRTPVPNAQVRLYSGDRTLVGEAESGADGEFVIPASRGAFYFLTVEKAGYAELTLAGYLLVRAGPAESLELQLSPSPVALEGIEVSVEGPDAAALRGRALLESRGFFEREAAGFGDFFTPEMIEARQPTYFSDIVVRLPGVRVDNGILKVWAGSDTCEPNIWLDGILVMGHDPLRQGWGGSDEELRRIDGRISASEVLAVEVYRSIAATPIAYTIPNAKCGTVLIWTG